MLSVLAERIRDNRFLRLIKGMLRAGYLEDWVWNATLSGAPQGGVVSPVLSNIYLDRLDNFVETVLIPEYTRGSRRVANPAGRKMENAMAAARERGDRASARKLRQQRRGLPYGDPRDPATAGSGISGTRTYADVGINRLMRGPGYADRTAGGPAWRAGYRSLIGITRWVLAVARRLIPRD